MYAKFSIPFRGVSSFMGSSARIWGWHMCKKDRMNRFGLQSQSCRVRQRSAESRGFSPNAPGSTHGEN
jgi:hypothetical protein